MLPMLAVYLLLLCLLALFTAYTRNFQRTVVALANQLDPAAAASLMPRSQRLRTVLVLTGWPLALGLGMLFVAWWKAVALVVAAFLLLVPVLGSLTPRANSRHYVARIRADLAARSTAAGADGEALRDLLARLDRLRGSRPT